MKTVKTTEILDYYDGILLFVAQDPIGGQYIGELVETSAGIDRFAVVGVTPQRMKDFRDGRIDLRALMLEMGTDEWFIATPTGTVDDPLTLELQHQPIADVDVLPYEGYFLEPDEPPNAADLQRKLERGKPVAISGQIQQANLPAGEWTLRTDHGAKSGRTYPGGPTLEGLQLGRLYRFTCAEVTESGPLWRDCQIFYLKSIELT